jgi:3-phosphoshikimate 1-carboxyvinyltransferase
MTARALVLGAIATGTTTIIDPLRARDSELMAAGLRAMGLDVSTVDDDRWTVHSGELRGPAHVDVGLAGTVMRFLPPVAGLAHGTVTFDGDPRARSRPLAPLLHALRDVGVNLAPGEGGGLPLSISGTGHVRGGQVVIDASASSQLVSGLLLAAAAFDHGMTVAHVGPPVPSAPHLAMTVQMLRAAGVTVDTSVPDVWSVSAHRPAGRTWVVEPDLSGAAPFLAAAVVTGGTVTVPGWPNETTQPGDQLRDLLTRMGARVDIDADGLTVRGTGQIRGIDADLSEIGELTPVLAALTTLADRPSHLRGVAHIRTHETDRVTALATELGRLGADVTEYEDGIRVTPRPMRGARFETYADHRMAHAAAVVGLAVEGVVLSDVSCTSKTMPEFPELWRTLVEGGR